MKKIFTLAALLFALTINVDAQYRKSWDFTKWSDATHANLIAGSDWSDIEKAADTAPTDISKENCFWQVGNSSAGISPMTANGEPIKELEGLKFINSTSRSLAIAVNYPATSLGEYHGPSYLWLGSKNVNYFVIPGVEAGTTIKIGLESHKPAEARGVQLFVGEGNSGTQLMDPDGVAVPTPTTYEEYTWYVPTDLTDTPNEDGTYNVTVRNTNGCHLYFIQVGDGDSPEVQDAKKVAYVASSEDPSNDGDFAWIYVSSMSGIEPTIVLSSTVSSLEELQAYDLVMISPTVQATDAIVPTLKSAIAYEPVLNLNAALYAAWGLGEVAATDATVATVSDLENELFENIDVTAGLVMQNSVGITGVNLGEYFANDVVLANAGDAVAIHKHNPARNSYMFLAYTTEALVDADQDVLSTLLTNAIKIVADTKKDVTSAPAPSISQDNQNGLTVVTISDVNAEAVVRYTVDGSDPTAESPIYTDALFFTAPATVKAIAFVDGYNPSNITTAEVAIYTQAAEPSIEVAQNGAESTVTITAEEGLNIFYNFTGNADAAKSQAYTEPIVLTEPTYVYAFTTANEKLNSVIASRYVAIATLNAQTIRLDTIAHFDASVGPWFVDGTENADSLGNGKNSAYYFWGKNAWNYYSEEIDHEETVVGSEGQDSTVYYYKPDPTALKYIYPLTDTPWRLKSQGQVLTGELTLAPEYAVGNGATGRYAETAEDNIGNPSKGVMTFGGKTSGEPYTAAIETTKKFAGPFDVVVYIGNGNSGSAGVMEVQTSTDAENWETLGTLAMAGTQRYWKKNRVAYEGTDEVYVRVAQTGGGTKAQVYDILLFNNGELSKAYDPVIYEGIVGTTANAEVIATEVFSIDGMRLSQTRKGINIVRQRLSNGTTRTSKILVK